MDPLAAKICELGRRAYEQGLLCGAEGNISCRLGTGEILCTPTGLCKGLLTPEDICVVESDGHQTMGHHPPSSEIRMHLALYAADASIQAVVHAHPPFATTFAVLGRPLPRGILQEAEILLGEVALADYATTGTQALAEVLRPLPRRHTAALLRNHGAVTWGADLESTYQLMETLEAVCRVLYQARQLGTPQRIPPGQLRELEQMRAERRGIR
ncbi:MAG: class II aldolase/adducin family protein [Phycisphaerae bacterium]|nr:class II aldolase/adducin family protein [Phycisphaerae bacterium]